MASEEIHHKQANHNEYLANMLAKVPPYHDWAITAAFYASIHYFEGWLYNQYTAEYKRHTETSIPTNKEDGKKDLTPHAWREELVRQKLGKEAYRAFRELRTTSENSRYLSYCQIKCINSPASEYYSPEQAKRLVGEVLKNFKQSLPK